MITTGGAMPWQSKVHCTSLALSPQIKSQSVSQQKSSNSQTAAWHPGSRHPGTPPKAVGPQQSLSGGGPGVHRIAVAPGVIIPGVLQP